VKFNGRNIERVKEKQKEFWAKALGSQSIQYTGKGLVDGHRGLNITDEEYDLVGQFLLEACAELGVHSSDMPTIIGAYNQYRSMIVGK
jgi:hemoglobin-like flavoprotein